MKSLEQCIKLPIFCRLPVMTGLHVKKSVLFFPQIKWYDYNPGSLIPPHYQLGIVNMAKSLVIDSKSRFTSEKYVIDTIFFIKKDVFKILISLYYLIKSLYLSVWERISIAGFNISL